MSLPRVLARRSYRTHVPKLFYRQNSSRSSSLRNAAIRGVVIGAAAAGTFTLAGYAIYRVSGAKEIVDTVKPALALLGKSEQRLAQGAVGEALKYLRAAAKAYVANVPFVGFLVDEAFDAAENVAAEHSEEASAIIIKACNDIYGIIVERGNEHVVSGAVQVVAAARRLLSELLALGTKAAQPLSERLDSGVAAAATSASASFESVKSKANELLALGTKAAQPLSERLDSGVAAAATSASASFESVKSKANELLALGTKAAQPLSERLDSGVAAAATSASAAFESVKSKANGIFGNKSKEKRSDEYKNQERE